MNATRKIARFIVDTGLEDVAPPEECAGLTLPPQMVGCLAATLRDLESVDSIGTVMEMAVNGVGSTPACILT